MVEYKIEVLRDGVEWLVSFKSKYNDLIYVVSICITEIDFENKEVEYIHIENIYKLSEEEIRRCYDIFEVIEREVVEEIKSL